MIEISEVREFLNNLPEARVSDATIELQIELANTVVESEKSVAATPEQVKDAKLARAAHLTMLSYASQIERSTGIVPAPIISHLAVLEELSERLLRICQRGTPTYKPMNEQWSTLLQQYVEGDIVEDWDRY